MKSVLAFNEFVTTLADNNVANLTRGQACCITQRGQIVAGTETFDPDTTFQFVVGLGEGKVKYGVVLNIKRSRGIKTPYAAQDQRVINLTDLSVQTGTPYLGTEVRLSITLPSRDSYMWPKNYVTVVVVVEDPAETSEQIIARLVEALQARLDNINQYYGRAMITIASTPNSITFTGEAGLDFNVHFEGNITGTSNVNNADIIGSGSQSQISDFERKYDVAAQGYNPNYSNAFPMYGDIFTAGLAETYDQWAITSRMDRTHPFNINTLGMEVTQFLAMAVGGTGAATLDTVVQRITTIDSVTELPVAP